MPPTSTVCPALRSGGAPVYAPLTAPKTSRATPVAALEAARAVPTGIENS
jgi:hypothetical protein